MIENGEVVKFPDEPKMINEKKRVNNAAPEISGLNNMSTPSKIKQTSININTPNTSIHPSPCSTPISALNFSTDEFSNGSYVGIEDILRIIPSFINDSRSTGSPNCKRANEENLSSKFNALSTSSDNTSNSTLEYAKRESSNKRKYGKLEGSGKKLKFDCSSTNRNEQKFFESSEKTTIANDQNENVHQIALPRNGNSNTLNFKVVTPQIAIRSNHAYLDKQNITNNKPKPPKILTMNSTSLNNGDRIIQNNQNRVNFVQYLEDTLPHVACSTHLPVSNPGKDLGPSVSNSNYEKTTNIQILQDVQLRNADHEIYNKQESNIKKQLSQVPKINTFENQSCNSTNNTSSSLQETGIAIDLSRKGNFQETKKQESLTARDAPTLSESKKETPTVCNSTGNIKKRLQDTVECKVASSQPNGGQKQQNLIKLKTKLRDIESRVARNTSHWQIRSKDIAKNANKKETAVNMSIDANKTKISNRKITDVNENSSKIGSSKASASTTKIYLKGDSKNKKMKITENRLLLIRDLFSKYIRSLPDTEKETIKMFNDMHNRWQCICLELLTSQKKWYNILKFSEKIRPDMEHGDIFEMVRAFQKNGIVDTEYQTEHEVVLLNQLSKDNLIKICDDLEKEGLKIYNRHKPNEKLDNKKLIVNIHSNCNTQYKIDLLKRKIQNRMGKCMRINENFRQIFYSVYLLGTYTNPRFSKMEDYFKSMLVDKDTFPQYPVDEYVIFASWADFRSYSKAKMYEMNFKSFSHDAEELRQICGKIFAELKIVGNGRIDDERFRDAPHLTQFTARAVYVTTLSNASDVLLGKYPESVQEWLEFMIRHMKEEFPHEIGRWYYNLIGLYMKFLKPFDYNRAAEELIKVLVQERKNLSDVQLHRIFERGRELMRKDEVLRANKDNIAELEFQLLRHRIEKFPVKPMDVESGMSKIEYYKLLHSTWGGNKIIATFILLFFDIIYTSTKYIRGAYVSKMQIQPLDINTHLFYMNRKSEIERRLMEIESEWSDDRLINFLKQNYHKHSHEFVLCKIDNIISDTQILENLIEGFGRKILAKIYKRLAENFTEHKTGFPDLLVSNAGKKKYFRAVKKSSAKLSIEETLWLDCLRSNETKVEIAPLRPLDIKKCIKKGENNDLPKASTSSPSDKVP
ncbi:uncharacterized protein LOC108913631 isoform X2 [Anoplophora glabripennis]|nr:uncharacterized protein LOC108913631 isoform X2 [Anoplophora glabripennis]